ncbi:MAG TPA: hypothetical protein VN895_07230 [Candidatus Acidoferrum sp.]|jgi:hypothetical protein|nr:hypothetical protein [Candidatus Acidoferrum sp.]
MTHRVNRIALGVLELFVMLTAVQGAIFVIPNLPPAWIKGTPFADYTIPALALGIICGGGSLIAGLAVMFRPLLGGALSVMAGMVMIGFELVEISVVGFTLVTNGPGTPQAWLQVIYLAVGTAIVLLGMRLFLAEGATTVRRLGSAWGA